MALYGVITANLKKNSHDLCILNDHYVSRGG